MSRLVSIRPGSGNRIFMARSLLGRLNDRHSTGRPEFVTSFDVLTQSAQSAAEKQFCQRLHLAFSECSAPRYARSASTLNVRQDPGGADSTSDLAAAWQRPGGGMGQTGRLKTGLQRPTMG